LYFRSVVSVSFVASSVAIAGAPSLGIKAEARLINLLPYFTSYRVESIRADITLAESATLFECVTATWDRDTPTNVLGNAVVGGTATYQTLQELQNFKVHQSIKESIVTKWKMSPSINVHTEFENIPAVTTPITATSYLNGGVLVCAVADAAGTGPAFRSAWTYKVRLSGRKNI